MRNYAVCILDNDIHYAKAFIKAVALDHAGVAVGVRSACVEGCGGEYDVCIGFGGAGRGACEKAFEPSCGKYGGISAILSEARKFVIDNAASSRKDNSPYISGSRSEGTFSFGAEALICVHAFAGGTGTSCAAIGVGRELARYRGEQVLYLSLEDVEDQGLYSADLCAMRAEEVLYRYLRLLNNGAGKEEFVGLFDAAFARDEYGLFRLAPDEVAGSMAALSPGELYVFLSDLTIALGFVRVVLDFGTRLGFLKAFAALPERGETLLIEVRPEGREDLKVERTLFSDKNRLAAVFPVCDEDVRRQGEYTDVGIANAFGLAVKKVCDRITGEAL